MMVLDQAIAELEVPPPDPGRWAGRLAEVAGQMRAVLGRHRDIVPSSIGLLAGDGRALRCHERVLAILRCGGLLDSRVVAGDGSCTVRAGKTRLTDGPFSSWPANSKLTRRDGPAHRGLGRAVVVPSFDAGPLHILRTGMRGVVGGPG